MSRSAPLLPLSLVLACNGPVVSATTTAESTGASTGADSSSGGEVPTSSAPTADASSGGESSSGATDTGHGVLPSGPLQAGAAYGYVTGPVGTSMAGFGGRAPHNKTPWNDVLNGAIGFYGYGVAKAVVLEVEGERLVLLKIPTMSSEASMTEGTIAKLKENHGIDLEGRIITNATHSHHNIARYWRLPAALAAVGADSPDEEVIDRITTRLAEVVAAAVDDLGPAEWGTTYKDDWDPQDLVYRDRRGENNPTYGKDTRLTVLAVRRPDGPPLAALLNFGMHGTVFDEDNELFTEDAPGGLEMKFEEHFFEQTGEPILAMFVQSGGGDMSPAGDRMGHPGPQRIELLGHDAAPLAHDVYKQLEWKSELTLGVRSRRIDLTYSGIGYGDYPEFKNAQDAPYTWGGWQCKGGVVDDENPATSSEGLPKDCLPLESLLESLGESIPNGEVHQMYLTVASLDDFFLVTLPGEPTYSVVKHVREELAARDVRGMVVGYSQDHMLYLTHPDDWFQGGYETEMSLWGPLAAKYLVSRQMEFVEALKQGDATPVWMEESPNLSLAKPWEPRAYEESEDPGELTADVPPEIARGETLRFAWGGGDASLGEPRVILQRENNEETFVDVPSPSGWAGAPFDNSRYHMITHYAPIPELSKVIMPSRQHHWYVDFQIPLDLPGGNYRLVARGAHWDGGDVQDHEVSSGTFKLVPGPHDLLDATLEDGILTMAWTHLPHEYIIDDTWPTTGYRLLDPTVAPVMPATIRAPITIEFTMDGQSMGDTYDVTYTDGVGYQFDFEATGLPIDNLAVIVRLKSDYLSVPLQADVLVKP